MLLVITLSKEVPDKAEAEFLTGLVAERLNDYPEVRIDAKTFDTIQTPEPT
ncbi:hypothetical protein LCGC14_1113850 [marine sediment metagenome]|uniref:Uncharacterized protein n=1 Tax=marine sediment metagenome TaxID=412755 RepID=A0A0F9MTY4_9ZZZZ